ncbi:MAG: hypothetical protein ACYCO3_15925 [Mycobacteriales bacterium]
MSGSGRHDEVGQFGDEEWSGVVFELGGRLDLPEDFSVPPLRLAPTDELSAAAGAAPAFAQLSSFVDWVGTGRRLGDDGDLEASEQEELAAGLGLEPEEWLEPDDEFGPYQQQAFLLTDWANAAGLVRQRGHRLLRTAKGRDMHADALGAWRAVFDAMVELGVADPGGNGPPWGATVDAAIADVIVLANVADKPLALSDVVERLCAEEEELLMLDAANGDGSADLREAIAEDARMMVDKLVEMGVVVREAEVLRGTPLGTWLAVRLLEEDGFQVALQP